MRKIINCFSVLAAALALFTGGVQAQSSLRPGDRVMISIAGVPATEQGQINREYSISEDGTVNLPYLKSPIMAGGRSPSDLETAIEAAYRGNEIYTAPTITVGAQQGARFVDISGQVRSPTRVPFTEDLTLMSAVSAAGGFSPYADEKKIKLTRGGKDTIIDMKRKGATDPTLEPGDKISVPESWF